MLLYALTIFLSAFLLFQVQPVLGRYILPWFGGSPAVWTTCMLFFQVALLAGYLYAHGVVSRLDPRRQGQLHLVLLAVSLALLPITPSPAWRAEVVGNPTWRILALLARSVGAPYLLLSATGPLLQGWFSRRYPGRSPYRLYALSNAGSLLGLLTYPVLVEPWLKLRPQTLGWSAGYALFAAFCGAVAWGLGRVRATERSETPAVGEEGPRPGVLDVLSWLALAACGSLMLLATTNQLCQDVAVVPFLWVVPLSIYLLTFIICFDKEQWYQRDLFLLLAGLAIWLESYLVNEGVSAALWVQALGYNVALFALCMACHGEMVRLKPSPRHLTLFYLMVSAGGALSGGFVALVAPRIFGGFWEFELGVTLSWVVFLAALGRDAWQRHRRRELVGASWAITVFTHVTAIALAGLVGYRFVGDIKSDRNGSLACRRNFYGVLRVVKYEEGDAGPRKSLRHGRINHGFQLTSPGKEAWKTSYYAETSGIGVAISQFPRHPIRVGVVGLGTGSIAAYAEEGDWYRFYDINPQVKELCDKHFTYLPDARKRGADAGVYLGDARLVMEQQLRDGAAQRFDVLAIDAFSGDAIPVHLLTQECAQLYWQHLAPDGILAIHISNRFINLRPVCRALGAARNATSMLIKNDDDDERGVTRSEWVLITRNHRFLATHGVLAAMEPWEADEKFIAWTDDFSNLYQLLRLKK